MKKIVTILTLFCLLLQTVVFTSCSENKTTTITETVATTEKKVDYKDDNNLGYTELEDGTLAVSVSPKQDEITVPEEYNGKKITTIGKRSFRMTKAQKITLPNTITTIEDFGFALSTKLETINIPEGVTHISQNTFVGCFSLKEIKLPETLETIDIYAFDASGLEEVTIPKNVKSIDQYAFAECSSLKKIIFEGKDVSISENVFNRSSKVVIHAPKNSSAIEYAKTQGINYKEI